MSGSTAAQSIDQVDYLDPSANLYLTEEEYQAIREQPFMNPELPRLGAEPESNKILESEKLLVETKREKVTDIFRQSTEIHDMIEGAKQNKLLVESGQAFDDKSLVNLLFEDRHFVNSKW